MIRLFLPVPNIWPAGPIFDWSLEYAQTFKNIPNVRAVSYTNGDLSNKYSPWYDLGEMFTRPMDDITVNIVLAPSGGFLKKACTVGMKNVAILNPSVSNYWHELKDLKNYDQIWTNFDFCSVDYFHGQTKFVPPIEEIVRREIVGLIT